MAGRPKTPAGGAADNDEPLAPGDDWRLPEDEDLSSEFDALRPRAGAHDAGGDDDALERELASLTARPGDDPYELDWPDDAKEARAAERAERARKAAIKPAPRLLAAASAGIGVTLLFILPVSLVAGAPGLLVVSTLPIVLIALILGLPLLVLIERVTKPLPRGITDVVLIVVGGAIGYGLTYVMATWLSAGQDNLETVRSVTSIFMMTAAASGFLAAHAVADSFRMKPKAVWLVSGLLAVLTVFSVLLNFFVTPTA